MVKDIRVTYKRRQSYTTRSNKIEKVRTPGGKLTVFYKTKTAKGPHCGDCGVSLPGLKHVRPKQLKNLKKRERTVSRAYGGSRCAVCVKQRIMRAFLIEEQKIVKKVTMEKLAKKKDATKA
jgi:large subunit ribosomal protein L34e